MMLSYWRLAAYALLTSFAIMIPLGAALVWFGVPWGLRVATFFIIGIAVGVRHGTLHNRRRA